MESKITATSTRWRKWHVQSKLIAFASAWLVATALTVPAPAQESAAEKRREQQTDTAAAGNAYKEPRMAAALSHLRQAEEELEKANSEHGGFRVQALQQVQQAEATIIKGIQWYNQNVLKKKK
jgi:Zn-dependent protease with chaperone function